MFGGLIQKVCNSIWYAIRSRSLGSHAGSDDADALHFKAWGGALHAIADMKVVSGNPDPKHVSTSYVERQNLTMRMSMRRFTRLTNGFSKKLENHAYAVALHFLHYNFARIHKTLRITPAMAAEISDHVWSLEEIAGLA